jgi:hypothetical protein
MMVLRRLEQDGRMAFLTDGRTAKVWSLLETPYAEVLYWCPKTKGAAQDQRPDPLRANVIGPTTSPIHQIPRTRKPRLRAATA